MSRSRKTALAAAAVLVMVVCVFLLAVLVGQGLVSASLWATVLGLPVGMVGAAATLWGLVGKSSKVLRPSDLSVPKWAPGRHGR